jgi:ATP-binding cassette subfamily B protein
MVALVTDLASQVISLLILLPILFSIDWKLTLALIGFLPLVYLVAAGFRNLARIATRQGTRAMGKSTPRFREAVTGIQIAKNFRQEAALYDRFLTINALSYKVNLRRGFVLSNVFPALNALMGVGWASSSIWAAWPWPTARSRWARGTCSSPAPIGSGFLSRTSPRSGASSRRACRPQSASLR